MRDRLPTRYGCQSGTLRPTTSPRTSRRRCPNARAVGLGGGSPFDLPMKIRVIIADARKLFREGVCALLERHGDIKVVGEADQGQAAVKLAEAMTPDVAVLNVSASTHGFTAL